MYRNQDFRSFPDEQWKEIKFEPGVLKKRYAISNYGRLISFDQTMKDSTLLKGAKLGDYVTLKVKMKGVNKSLYLHRLVAEHFIEKEHDKQKYVIHIDYNKKNNHVSNLKWACDEEMMKHKLYSPNAIEARKKLVEKRRLSHKGNKLTSTEVIRLKKKIFDPNRKTRLKILAKQFGISEMQLYRIKSGENWGHIKIENEN